MKGKSKSGSNGESPESRIEVFAGDLFRRQNGHGHGFTDRQLSTRAPIHRPSRIALLLTFAHILQRAIDRGEYRDRADAARKLGLTRARITQILDLTLLAPDIQEEILFMERVDGVEAKIERRIREVLRCEGWGEQRRVLKL